MSMRSARALSVKGPAGPGSTMAPSTSASVWLHADAPRALRVGEPFGEAVEARRPEGRDARRSGQLLQPRLGQGDELGADVLRQPVREALREAAERLVHDLAAQRRVELAGPGRGSTSRPRMRSANTA